MELIELEKKEFFHFHITAENSNGSSSNIRMMVVDIISIF